MKFLFKKLVESVASKYSKQKPDDHSHIMNKLFHNLGLFPFIFFSCIGIMFFATIVLVLYYFILSPSLNVIMFSELKPGTTMSDATLNDMWDQTGSNYTTNCLNHDEGCVNEKEKQFQIEMRNIFDYYRRAYGVSIYTSLTTATVLYDVMDYDVYFDTFDFANMIPLTDLNGPVSSNLSYGALNAYLHHVSKKQISKRVEKYCNLYDKFGTLIDRYLAGTDDKLDVDNFPERLPYCLPNYTKVPIITYYHDLDKYKKYLKEEYIPDNITLPKEDSQFQIDVVTNFMFDLSSLARYIIYDTAPSSAFTVYSSSCSSITVADPKHPEKNGTYSLEDYVAGVVSDEVGGFSFETLKAQAVAVRSYVISTTNNCQNPVTNTTASYQSFNPNPSQMAIEAAQATAGEVLTRNGQVITAYYSAYPRDGVQWAGTDGCSVSCNNGQCTTTLYKSPTLAKWEFVMPETNSSGKYWNGLSLSNQGGHCIGMSQIGAEYLATQGYTYDKILSTFYDTGAGVSISKLNFVNKDGLQLTSSGFYSRTQRPNRENGFFYTDHNTSFAAGNEGECVWYAVGRANEILTSSGINYTWKYAGNGGNFCDGVDFDMGHFQVSRDYTQPKVGALVSWKNGSAAGHVAVIEAVHEDGTVDIGEAYVKEGGLVGEGARFSTNTAFWAEQKRLLNTQGIQAKKNISEENCESNGSGCYKLARNVPLNQIYRRWNTYQFQCYIYLTEPR